MKNLAFFTAPLALQLACATVPLIPERSSAPFVAPQQTETPPEVQIVPLQMGVARAPRCVPAGEATCWVWTSIAHGAYWVSHPHGTFLIDAGVSAKGPDDVGHFGFGDRFLFAYQHDRGLKQALEESHLAMPDFVLLTHAHWDHTSGLVDLDHPKVVLAPGEEEFVRAFPTERSATVRPDHLANAQWETFAWDGPAYENFPVSHDWFGDGAVVVVPLPGHTPGSVGIFVNNFRGRRLFFIGDAGWSMEAIEIPSHKLKLFSDKVDNDTDTLAQTLWKLHALHERYPNLLMVPAHDLRAMRAVQAVPRPGSP